MLIAVGDFVRSVSGGPLMRVEALDGEVAICAWFSLRGRLNRSRYAAGELVFAFA